ncbi:hypothetical protein Ae168Ps1_0185c [Pseudonocardia sp. Ae168_Ps1]|uniref:hypothetical protein n=1 Tax=unclassified Pseudonocardia TaxID=2619320 RepID=UPI0001FFF0DF|nr:MULTISPECIES: hypothetical protein [unclassified Pseudonocardia]OLL71811.1 hypothetical protein Ae150APs1_0189c [Pseudonocardia sp. Ae150A_Ps1]OLL77779.1 hypothetical protein Ae168Ps1_0185c [Pseudonocardia sp. Ae168_Ps1]OLL88097.1 hypothetical protein Ae263Ps1_5152 [Pseudonocardia sp. Ae263_Ps1]OLM18390.1 hypothetical protein Ae707Ps1_2649c [Pseudonocardia sp. Ae707_Ps1]
MSTPNRHVAPASSPTAPVVALRALTVASLVVLAWQFVTAAGLFTGGGVGPHGTGAIVLHVVTGLAAAAALWVLLARGGPWWPSALAVVLFAFTFVQAWFGDFPGLVVHVPGAMALTAGTAWLTAWSFLRLP